MHNSKNTANIARFTLFYTSLKNKLKDEVGMIGSKSTQIRLGIITSTIHYYHAPVDGDALVLSLI